MKVMSVLAIVTMIMMLVKMTPDVVMTACTSASATGVNQTVNVPTLVFPPPTSPSAELADNASLTRTNTSMTGSPTGNYTNGTALVTEGPRQIIQSKPTGNYTNGTALVTEGPRQIITGRPATAQIAPQNQPGQNIANAPAGSNPIIIPNINITKAQAAKAEQEANLMIDTYYEKLELEKQRQEQEAAALTAAAAAQSNQTGGEETEEAEDTPAETEIGIEEEEEEEGEEEDEDNNNEDENDEAEDDDE
jgi:hypothetical protein